MEKYGPLRELWEGGYKGEGYLRFLKPQLNQGFRANWHVNCMKNLLAMKAFDSILGTKMNNTIEMDWSSALSSNRGSLHLYQSQNQVADILNATNLQSKVPISVVLFDSGDAVGRLFCVVEDYEHVIEIICQQNNTNLVEKFGLVYHKFKSANNHSVISWESKVAVMANERSRLGFGMLLPLLDEVDNDNKATLLFALVSSSWQILGKKNTIADLIE